MLQLRALLVVEACTCRCLFQQLLRSSNLTSWAEAQSLPVGFGREIASVHGLIDWAVSHPHYLST